MMRLTRPSAGLIERYWQSRLVMAPTFESGGRPAPGFRVDHASIRLAGDAAVFDRAKDGLRVWAVQRGAGVDVYPPQAELTPDATVAIISRQLGLWFVAACRITAIVDTVTAFGFTYATLPGHPERGAETFTVTHSSEGGTQFEVAATWRPGDLLSRLGGPVTTHVQRRATQRYLAAMVRWCDER